MRTYTYQEELIERYTLDGFYIEAEGCIKGWENGLQNEAYVVNHLLDFLLGVQEMRVIKVQEELIELGYDREKVLNFLYCRNTEKVKKECTVPEAPVLEDRFMYSFENFIKIMKKTDSKEKVEKEVIQSYINYLCKVRDSQLLNIEDTLVEYGYNTEEVKALLWAEGR